jgi:hypothetical protein
MCEIGRPHLKVCVEHTETSGPAIAASSGGLDRGRCKRKVSLANFSVNAEPVDFSLSLTSPVSTPTKAKTSQGKKTE